MQTAPKYWHEASLEALATHSGWVEHGLAEGDVTTARFPLSDAPSAPVCEVQLLAFPDGSGVGFAHVFDTVTQKPAVKVYFFGCTHQWEREDAWTSSCAKCSQVHPHL